MVIYRVLIVLLLASVAFADNPKRPAGQDEVKRAVRDATGPEVEKVAFEVAPLARRVVEDPLNTPEQKRRLAVFHGLWDLAPEPTAAERAAMALLRGDPSDAALDDEAAPALLRAEGQLQRGEPARAVELLAGDESARAALLRAEGLVELGRSPEAVAVLAAWREKAQTTPIDNAVDLTAAARMLILLAELEGRPAQDYHVALSMLGKARELDPTYWPTQLAEAQLLASRDNRGQAGEALEQAIPLNVRSAAMWRLLGDLFAEGYAFAEAQQVLDALRALDAASLPAAKLETSMRLMQRDAAEARAAITPALQKYPGNLDLQALDAAVTALTYDEAATEAALARFDERHGSSALAHFTAGKYLAEVRQYAWAERLLRESIRREPNHAAAHVELGLLLMQAGHLDNARRELREAVRLDPFNRRADNQLRLVDEMLGYATIETDHFVIRFKDGIDRVLAEDMPAELERIYRNITGVFQHRPAVKTQIDLMPDEELFGVRITGMPDIWTIAAATGDVISMVPPRQGPKQRGPYNWVNVIGHEYVHTVTLDQTRNRIPHWFTEACAVSQETTGRSYDTCQLLAAALRDDKLFALEDINWGFVRPRTPQDRPLAYAQADWMLQFIAERFGHQKIVELLQQFHDGATDQQAFQSVLGLDGPAFTEQFKAWAGEQVKGWGLAWPPVKVQDPKAMTLEQVDALLKEHVGHPGVLKLRAEKLIEASRWEEAWSAVQDYAAARPVDPWTQRQVVMLAQQLGRPREAVAALEVLDRQDNESGAWGYQLAQLHRAAGELPQAQDAARRALLREPYNAKFRELAATIALQRQDLELALHHLKALPLLEPGRATHQVRLAAILHKMGRADEAKAAAEAARKLDPAAPVGAFTGE